MERSRKTRRGGRRSVCRQKTDFADSVTKPDEVSFIPGLSTLKKQNFTFPGRDEHIGGRELEEKLREPSGARRKFIVDTGASISTIPVSYLPAKPSRKFLPARPIRVYGVGVVQPIGALDLPVGLPGRAPVTRRFTVVPDEAGPPLLSLELCKEGRAGDGHMGSNSHPLLSLSLAARTHSTAREGRGNRLLDKGEGRTPSGGLASGRHLRQTGQRHDRNEDTRIPCFTLLRRLQPLLHQSKVRRTFC
jgi:hypothetical protein